MNWVNYLLQVNLYLLISFGFYWVFLRNETFYQANRLFLIFTSVISFAIPTWNLGIIQSWFVTEQVSSVIAVISLEEFQVQNFYERPTWSWNLLAISIYFVGFGFSLLKFSLSLFKLQQLFTIQNLEGQAFSVFGKIIIDKKLAHYEAIRSHEEVHSREFHSIDVFWFELIGVICWFNPAVLLLRKEIKLIHEFIADGQVANQLGSQLEYAQILVSTHFKANSNTLINNFFNKSILKKRIMKLAQQKSKRTARLKYALAMPVFIGMMVIANACENNTDEAIQAEVSPELAPLSDEIFLAVEQQPEFKGGVEKMYQFIGENIKYPQKAQEAKVEGRVFVKFVIDKDGNARDFTILKGIGHGCDEESIRVLNTMPKWNPGMQSGKPVNVYFTMPIHFKLEDNSTSSVKAKTTKNLSFLRQNPIYKALLPTDLQGDGC